MTKLLFVLAVVFMSSAQAQTRDDVEKNRSAEIIKQAHLLKTVAMAASLFAHDFGCIPRKPSDLMRATKDRLLAIGCTNIQDNAGEYIFPAMWPEVQKLLFVQRWDGVYVIEWGEKQRKQCSFLDAEQVNCAELK